MSLRQAAPPGTDPRGSRPDRLDPRRGGRRWGRSPEVGRPSRSGAAGRPARLAAPSSLGGRIGLLTAAVAFTLACVQYSLRHQSLLFYLTFDDVTYLLDGATRLQHFYYAGATRLVQELLHEPPHSIYSSFEAFFSFMVCGFHDWAPYAGNVVLVVVFLALCARMARGLRAWHKACLALLLLSFPVLGYTVMTCRPDFAAAVLTMAGVWAVLARPRHGHLFVRALRRRLAAGALFGAAILVKPAVFPATIAVLGNCLLGAAACDWLDPSARRTFRARGVVPALAAVLRTWAQCVAACLLVAGPYFLVAGKTILRYIWDNTYGVDADLWKIGINRGEHLLYYLGFPSGNEMLGDERYVLGGVFVISLVFLLVRRRRREWLRAAAFVWVVVVSYAICTVNPLKHMFLGLTFQVAAIYLAVIALSGMVLTQRLRRQPPWAEAVLALSAVAAVVLFQWPTRQGDAGSAAATDKRETVRRVYEAVRERIDSPGAGPVRGMPTERPANVLLTITGELNAALLNYYALLDFAPAHFEDLETFRTPEAYYPYFGGADFVIVADPGFDEGLTPEQNQLVTTWLPGAKFQDRLLAHLRGLPDFLEVARIEYPPNHKCFYLFKREGPFFGLKPLANVGQVEGPYPQWKLPLVRWGVMPASRLAPDPALGLDKAGGWFDLVFSAKGQLPGQEMIVRVDGREMGRHRFKSPAKFEDAGYTFDLQPGPHEITIDYAKGQGPDPARQMAVLFQVMRLTRSAYRPPATQPAQTQPEQTQPVTAPTQPSHPG